MFAIYFWSAVAALGIVGAMWVAEKLDPRFTKKQTVCVHGLPVCESCTVLGKSYPVYDLDDDGHWYISAWTCECEL